MEKSIPFLDLLWISLVTNLGRNTSHKLVSANDSPYYCPPAEENQPHNLTFTWKFDPNKNYKQITVENIHSLISTCTIEGNSCKDVFRGDLARSVLCINNVTGDAILTVKLGNVSQNKPFNPKGKWSLKYQAFQPPFLSCNLSIVATDRPIITDCPPVLDAGTDLMCTCNRRDNSRLQTTLVWLDNNKTTSIENTHINSSTSVSTIDSPLVEMSSFDQNIPVIIMCVIGGNILIITIVATVFCYKKKTPNGLSESCFPCKQEKTKQRNDYDTINGGYLVVDYGVTGDRHQYETTRALIPSHMAISGGDDTILDENHYETIDDVRDFGDKKKISRRSEW